MKIVARISSIFLLAINFASYAQTNVINYDESADGDLSCASEPFFILGEGTNTFVGTEGGLSGGSNDFDCVNFTIPSGHQLDAVTFRFTSIVDSTDSQSILGRDNWLRTEDFVVLSGATFSTIDPTRYLLNAFDGFDPYSLFVAVLPLSEGNYRYQNGGLFVPGLYTYEIQFLVSAIDSQTVREITFQADAPFNCATTTSASCDSLSSAFNVGEVLSITGNITFDGELPPVSDIPCVGASDRCNYGVFDFIDFSISVNGSSGSVLLSNLGNGTVELDQFGQAITGISVIDQFNQEMPDTEFFRMTASDSRVLDTGWTLTQADVAANAIFGVIDTLTTHTVVPSIDQINTLAQGGAAVNLVFDDPTGQFQFVQVFPIQFGEVTSNAPPTANAGEDRAVRQNDLVMLDGTGSFDDNTPTASLLYDWRFEVRPQGSVAVLAGSNSATPSFTVDAIGTYEIELVVTDAAGLQSSPDIVVVSSDNLAPTADAGVDQLVIVGSIVNFDGSSSTDPEMDELLYLWSIDARPDSSLTDLVGPETSTPSFTPDIIGEYEVSLTVSDFIGPGAPDSALVTAVSAEDFAQLEILEASDALVSVPPANVTTEGNQTALGNFLRQATVAIQEGDIPEAVDKLQKAIARTDGCVLRGIPDGDGPERDWVTNCTDQATLYESLTSALQALRQ
jgi:hypothetical protein